MQTVIVYCLISLILAGAAILLNWPLIAVGVAYAAGFTCGMAMSLWLDIWSRVVEKLAKYLHKQQ